jgi:hypothetical protein
MSESPFDAPGEMVLINAKGGGRSSAMSRMMSATSALGQPATNGDSLPATGLPLSAVSLPTFDLTSQNQFSRFSVH